MRYLSEKDKFMKGLYKLAVAFEKASQTLSLKRVAQKLEAIDPFMQYSLNNLGHTPPIKVDGLLGPETKNALNWFKREFGLTPTTSPDLVYKQVRNEAAKLTGKPNQQMVAKAPEQTKAPEQQALNLRDTFDKANFVDPNSGNFTSLK